MSNELFGAAVILLTIAAFGFMLSDTGPKDLRKLGLSVGVALTGLAMCAFFGGAFTT